LFATLSPQKATHNGLDMMRWADLLGVPLKMPAAHPMRTVEALRATIACGNDAKVIHGFYRAYWIENRPPSDPSTMRDVVSGAGHDPAILEKLALYKDNLRARTDRAIAHGIFGAPSYVVNGEMYWGQDRMDFVERALRTANARTTTR
jgi:2-hydroxychromene-2-carboxylate isomerase